MLAFLNFHRILGIIRRNSRTLRILGVSRRIPEYSLNPWNFSNSWGLLAFPEVVERQILWETLANSWGHSGLMLAGILTEVMQIAWESGRFLWGVLENVCNVLRGIGPNPGSIFGRLLWEVPEKGLQRAWKVWATLRRRSWRLPCRSLGGLGKFLGHLLDIGNFLGWSWPHLGGELSTGSLGSPCIDLPKSLWGRLPLRVLGESCRILRVGEGRGEGSEMIDLGKLWGKRYALLGRSLGKVFKVLGDIGKILGANFDPMLWGVLRGICKVQ